MFFFGWNLGEQQRKTPCRVGGLPTKKKITL